MTFRHLSRSICRLEDSLRFTFLFFYSEGRPELSLDTLFIISPATATARMTFLPADPVPGLNISPLFMDPNGLFPVQPYTLNFGMKFFPMEDNITATSNLMFILVITSATAQGKQIKAVPLTMVHAPSYLPASSCRITKHLATLHIISHSPECPYHRITFRSWTLAYRS